MGFHEGCDMLQAIEHDAEELIKWDRAMKRCQQTLADSARFAAWHSVSLSSLRTVIARVAHFEVVGCQK